MNPSRWRDRQFVFTLCTGRCGSTSLFKYTSQVQMGDAPRVFPQHEGGVFMPSRTTFPGLYLYRPFIYEKGYVPSEVAMILEDNIRVWCRMLPPGITFFQAHAEAFYSEVFDDLFPDAKYIHLVRDPVAFVRSGINNNWYAGQMWDGTRIWPEDLTLSQGEKIAWAWKAYHEHILAFLEKIPSDRKMFVRTEDLDQDLCRIMLFCGCDYYCNFYSTINGGRVSVPKPVGTDNFMPYLMRECRDLMSKFGYLWEADEATQKITG